jgi:hypothetical protein
MTHCASRRSSYTMFDRRTLVENYGWRGPPYAAVPTRMTLPTCTFVMLSVISLLDDEASSKNIFHTPNRLNFCNESSDRLQKTTL